MTDLLLGIDLGTTLVKAGLFDPAGQLLGLGRTTVPRQEAGDTCELPTADFWRVVADAVGEALRGAGAVPGQVAAVSYASQANSFLLLDEHGAPLTPLVLWPDRRADDLTNEVIAPWATPDAVALTGVGVGSIEFAACKLAWFRQREPETWRRMRYVQTISDYLVHGLTGERLGDLSTASMLALWDQPRSAWWREGLAWLALRPAMLSRPLRTGLPLGRVTPRGAALSGLNPGALVVAGGLDHFVAALGAGVGSVADVAESTGTVLACTAMAPHYAPRMGCCTGPANEEGTWYQLAFGEEGTSSIDAYQRQCAPGVSIADLLELAASVAPEPAGGPHTQAHEVRALLETNAAALGELLDLLCPDCRPAQVLATGGGARSEVWLQLKADLLGLDMLQVACEEPACLGAALLAGRAIQGAGDFGRRVLRRFTPDPTRHRLYQQLTGKR